jgi:hypothetical protein
MARIHLSISAASSLMTSDSRVERSLPLMLRPDPGRNPRPRRHSRLRFSSASLDWALALPALLIALFMTLGVSRSADDPIDFVSAPGPVLRTKQPLSSAPETPPQHERQIRLASLSKDSSLGVAEGPGSLDRLTLLALVQSAAPVPQSPSEAPPSPPGSAEALSSNTKEGAHNPSGPQPKRRAPEFKAFVGTWATSPNGCPKRAKGGEFIPIIIGPHSAKAGDTSCRFSDRVPEDGGWKVRAQCSAPPERWTANVQLTLSGNRLNWTSERGKQSYVRCT